MKIVKEHINFQRNVEPKQSMSTGAESDIFECFKKLIELDKESVIGRLHIPTYDKFIFIVECYWGKTFLLENQTYIYDLVNESGLGNYLEFTSANIHDGKWIWKIKPDMISQFTKAIKKFNKLTESVNFERNKDPRDSMQTGDVMYRQMKNILDELEKEFGGYSKIHMRREATRRYPHKSYSMNWYYPHKLKDGTIEEYKFTFWNDSHEDPVQPFNTNYKVTASYGDDENPIIATADAGDEIGLVNAYIHKWLFQLIEHWEKYGQTTDDIALHRYKRKNK